MVRNLKGSVLTVIEFAFNEYILNTNGQIQNI